MNEKRNWLKLVIEILKVTAGFLVGTQL